MRRLQRGRRENESAEQHGGLCKATSHPLPVFRLFCPVRTCLPRWLLVQFRPAIKKSGALGGVRFLSRWWLGALFLSWLWSVPRTVSQIGGFVLSGFMSLKATPFTNRTRARRQRCVQASVSMCARRAPGVRAVPPGLQTRCLGWTARRRRRKFWGFQVVSNSFLPAWRGLGPIS